MLCFIPILLSERQMQSLWAPLDCHLAGLYLRLCTLRDHHEPSRGTWEHVNGRFGWCPRFSFFLDYAAFCQLHGYLGPKQVLFCFSPAHFFTVARSESGRLGNPNTSTPLETSDNCRTDCLHCRIPVRHAAWHDIPRRGMSTCTAKRTASAKPSERVSASQPISTRRMSMCN